jgi:hypothetical protein
MAIKERILQVGLVLLVAFAILVISLDIKKLISRTMSAGEPAVEQSQGEPSEAAQEP